MQASGEGWRGQWQAQSRADSQHQRQDSSWYLGLHGEQIPGEIRWQLRRCTGLAVPLERSSPTASGPGQRYREVPACRAGRRPELPQRLCIISVHAQPATADPQSPKQWKFLCAVSDHGGSTARAVSIIARATASGHGLLMTASWTRLRVFRRRLSPADLGSARATNSRTASGALADLGDLALVLAQARTVYRSREPPLTSQFRYSGSGWGGHGEGRKVVATIL